MNDVKDAVAIEVGDAGYGAVYTELAYAVEIEVDGALRGPVDDAVWGAVRSAMVGEVGRAVNDIVKELR